MKISLETMGKELFRQRHLEESTRECGFANIQGETKFVTLIHVYTINPIWNRKFYVGVKEFWYKDQKKDGRICSDSATIFVNLCPATETPFVLGYADVDGVIIVNDCFYQDDCLFIVDLEDKVYENFSRCAGYCANCKRDTYVEEKSTGSSSFRSGLGWLESVLREDVQS